MNNIENYILSIPIIAAASAFFKLYAMVKKFDFTDKVTSIETRLQDGKLTMDKHTEEIKTIQLDVRTLTTENQNHKLLHEDIKEQVSRIEDKIDMLLSRGLK